ncbi:uncharacterized protein LOC117584521 isoform X3 [Drosophila guanche]|uniref:uncharacterized protein LOC117584521 isoform X3 n=1 Tax=Drosophila guanche TaxID=7266 RepID=UPI001471250C|nr:uncharacterized protein LOC117584521 isoform X3 [Drosophila guanche]
MAMYFYASKISAIACGMRCKQTVLQKSRGQRDRDKCRHRRRRRCRHPSSSSSSDSDDCCLENEPVPSLAPTNGGVFSLDAGNLTAETALLGVAPGGLGIRYRRRHSAEQLSAYDLEMGFQQIELAAKTGGHNRVGVGDDVVQYDVPKNRHKRSQCDINFESSVLGSGGIMYINGRIVSGPLDSLVETLIPKNVIDLDKEFVFSFLLSSRLFLRPHELLGKLLDSVPDSECLESLVALLAEWTLKFPYDYRDERMMSHVKHIVARCSNSHLEAVVSQILSALLKRLTDLERHEADLRACQQTNSTTDKIVVETAFNCPTATQHAQIVCRLEKKLAKHIGGEEFLQCSSMILLDKQWSKLQVTCQQLDCMQRHAEGHGHLWQKQAIVLNEQGQPQSLKTDKQAKDKSSTSIGGKATSTSTSECGGGATTSMDLDERPSTSASVIGHPVGITGTSAMNAMSAPETATLPVAGNSNAEQPPTSSPATPLTGTALGKPNDWVVIPVFADIVKLALGERENCLQRLQNGHINMAAFDRMAAIVGAFTKHMQAMKTAQTPSSGEYEHFCRHMQQTTKLGEAELMMASFDCEEPNNAEKLMYDLN